MATGTPNYDFPLLDGQETVDIVNDVNALANSVDSALKTVEGASDGKAPVMHASEQTIYGLGTATSYGHLRTSDSYTDTSSPTGVAFTPGGANALYNSLNNAIGGTTTTATEALEKANQAYTLADTANTNAGNAATSANSALSRANEVNTNLTNAMKTWTNFQLTINTAFPGYYGSRQYCTGNKALNIIKLGITIDSSATVSGDAILLATLPAGWRPASPVTLIDMLLCRTVSSGDRGISFHNITINPNGQITASISSRQIESVHLMQFPIMTHTWRF